VLAAQADGSLTAQITARLSAGVSFGERPFWFTEPLESNQFSEPTASHGFGLSFAHCTRRANVSLQLSGFFPAHTPKTALPNVAISPSGAISDGLFRSLTARQQA